MMMPVIAVTPVSRMSVVTVVISKMGSVVRAGKSAIASTANVSSAYKKVTVLRACCVIGKP